MEMRALWARMMAIFMASLVVLAGAPSSASAATELAGFHPGNIISNESFFDATTMTPEQVTDFINARGAGCVPGPDGTPCLKDHVSDIPGRPETQYCKTVAAKPGATSAEVVHTTAVACGVNPQVLLVLLQKEQALLTASADRLYADRYAKATGLGCPDFQQCDPARATFFGQVYGAAERFQIYRAHPDDYRHKVGVPLEVAYHPEPLCGKAKLVIQNQATAGLYNYTPYVPNAESLAAVGGEGDLCSAYGNRNFYRYLRMWFPSAVTTSTAAPVQASPASSVTPQMAAIYQRAAQVGSATLGAATSAITCSSGTCTKEYAKATITWTSAQGTRVIGKLPRISGATRYDTAVAASRSAFPAGAPTVFLATGTGYADALATGPWAHRAGGPVLLTSQTELPAPVAAELRRLAPSQVVIVGGHQAVTASVEEAVRRALPTATVRRTAGQDRYATALEVSRAAFQDAGEVLVASGVEFADALVAGPLAAARGPILLMRGDRAPGSEIAEEIRRLGANRITVVGGPARISSAAEQGLRAVAPTERLSGATRYETATVVAARANPNPARIYLASGEVYPDALISTTLRTATPGVLLLSQRGCVPHATLAYIREHSTTPITLIGGHAALSGEVSALLPCQS